MNSSSNSSKSEALIFNILNNYHHLPDSKLCIILKDFLDSSSCQFLHNCFLTCSESPICLKKILASIKQSLQSHTKADEIEKITLVICLLARVYLQANCTGPSITQLRPTEEAVEQRKRIAQQLFPTISDDTEQIGSSEWEQIHKFWRTEFIFGCPDDRLGESTSNRCLDVLLRQFSDDLQIDGDTLCDSIRGIGFLWGSVYLLCYLLYIYSTPMELCDTQMIHPLCLNPVGLPLSLRLLRWRIAYLWQKSLSFGHINPSPTLSKIFVGDILTLFEQAKIISPPLQLFSSRNDEMMMHKMSTDDNKTSINSLDFLWRSYESVSKELASTLYDELPHEARIRILIELSINLTYIGQHFNAIKVLEITGNLCGLSWEYDSVLGARRSYQTKPVPQLVLQIKKTNEYFLEPKKEFDTTESTNVRNISLSELDPDTDILDKPLLMQDENGIKTETHENKTPLVPTDLLILLSYCYATFRSSTSYDLLTLEQLRAIVECCLSYSDIKRNWSLYTLCLWFRSKNEFHRSKTRDRGILQLQALVDQYWERYPSGNARVCYISQLAFPFRSSSVLELGQLMSQNGGFMSAFEMYKEMWMWEDAAECLIAAGRPSLALSLLEERLSQSPSPRLLCCIGDIKQNPEFYEKAWILSNERYARAQRSLGKYWFKQGNFEKTIAAFKKALTINTMFDDVWFTLGCCEMHLKHYDDALTSFTQAIALSKEGNGQAWANLAAIHTQRNRWDLAQSCIREAVKLCNENWKVWDTFIKISIKLKQFRDTIDGIKAMFDLGKKAEVPDWMFGFISDAGVSAAEIDVPTDKSKEDSLLALTFLEEVLIEDISNRPSIYDCCARVAAALEDYQKEFPLRIKQLRVSIANISTIIDPISFKTTTMPLLMRTIQDVVLSYRRWQYDPYTTEESRFNQAEDIYKILINLRDRLEQNQSSLMAGEIKDQLNEAIEFFNSITIQ